MENENEDADLVKDVAGHPEHVQGLHPELVTALERLSIPADRVHLHYSDVWIMCRNYNEAYLVAKAGPWKSIAEIVRTNPDHPDAKQFPFLCDIPLGGFSGYIASKRV